MRFRDYLGIIRRRGVLVAVLALAAALIAVGVSFVLPKTYEAEARVVITEQGTEIVVFGTVLPELSAAQDRTVQTEMQLLQSRSVAEGALERLGIGMDPDDLLEDIEVEQIGVSNVVVVKGQADVAALAADLTNALVDQYVDVSREAKRQSVQAAATEIETRLQELEEEILQIDQAVRDQGTTDELALDREIAASSLALHSDKLEQLRINEQLEEAWARVVDHAVPDEDAVSPRPLLNGAVGLLLGLVFSVGVALVLEYLDDSVHSGWDVEELLGVPLLGRIPEVVLPWERDAGPALAAAGTQTARAYLKLADRLGFEGVAPGAQTILVATVAAEDGKLPVAPNLAEGLAQRGHRVIGVTGDLREPMMAGYFGVSEDVGIVDVLNGALGEDAVIRWLGDRHPMVVGRGLEPRQPLRLLKSERTAQAMRGFAQKADWVIVDAPPVLAFPDAVVLAGVSDGVLLVVREGKTSKEQVLDAAEALERAGGRIVGSVLCGSAGGPSRRRRPRDARSGTPQGAS